MNNVSLPANRIYKERLFKIISNDKSELLKLYNTINGATAQPDQTEYFLSSLFCHTLRDYAEYVAHIRTYSAEMPLAGAVDKAITECIQENILRDFLLKNKAEAKAMSIHEYDEEKTMRMFREEGYEYGNQHGIHTGFEITIMIIVS